MSAARRRRPARALGRYRNGERRWRGGGCPLADVLKLGLDFGQVWARMAYRQDVTEASRRQQGDSLPFLSRRALVATVLVRANSTRARPSSWPPGRCWAVASSGALGMPSFWGGAGILMVGRVEGESFRTMCCQPSMAEWTPVKVRPPPGGGPGVSMEMRMPVDFCSCCPKRSECGQRKLASASCSDSKRGKTKNELSNNKVVRKVEAESINDHWEFAESCAVQERSGSDPDDRRRQSGNN